MRGRNSEKNAIKRLLSAPSTHEPAKNKKVHKAQRGRIAPTLVISARNAKSEAQSLFDLFIRKNQLFWGILKRFGHLPFSFRYI
jgi:hypothetical protein